MEAVNTIALTLGVGWASGINLYAVVFMLGALGATGNIDLPPALGVLENPMVIGTAAVMYCVEFFADPGTQPLATHAPNLLRGFSKAQLEVSTLRRSYR